MTDNMSRVIIPPILARTLSVSMPLTRSYHQNNPMTLTEHLTLLLNYLTTKLFPLKTDGIFGQKWEKYLLINYMHAVLYKVLLFKVLTTIDKIEIKADGVLLCLA
jgi:hypothetical protein